MREQPSDGEPEYEVLDVPGERGDKRQRPWEVLTRDTYKSNLKAQALEWLAQQGVFHPRIRETSWECSTAWIFYCHDCNDCTKAWRFTLREELGVRWMVVEIDGACTGNINRKWRKLHLAMQYVELPGTCSPRLLAIFAYVSRG